MTRTSRADLLAQIHALEDEVTSLTLQRDDLTESIDRYRERKQAADAHRHEVINDLAAMANIPQDMKILLRQAYREGWWDAIDSVDLTPDQAWAGSGTRILAGEVG